MNRDTVTVWALLGLFSLFYLAFGVFLIWYLLQYTCVSTKN